MLYRRMGRFEIEGMEFLFDSEPAKRRRRLPPAMRRLIVEVKAEYPPLNLNEIANIVYVRFGRRPDPRSVRRVLKEEPISLKILKRFAPYHEMPKSTERRMPIVELHSEGWSAKAIAGYLKTSKPTVYRALRKWIEEGVEGLDDKKRGQKGAVRKVDLKAIDAVRRLQQNPNLGEFRVHAALAQMGIHLSLRTCGRILALNRKLYGLQKPKVGRSEKKPMPFASNRRHEYWTADVRYIDHRLGATSTPSPSSRTTRGRSWRVASRALRTQAPSSRCSTGPSSATDRRRHWSRTAEASSDPTRHKPFTKLWASARRRSSGASPGSPTWKRCSTYSAGWQTSTSFGQKAGRSWWRRTRSGLRTTTSRATGPIAREGTAAARRRRFWGGSPGCATAKRIWSARSSRCASREYSTLWATLSFGAGDFTERKGSREGRPPSGCRRRASPWSTPENPFPAMRWSTLRVAEPASCW